MKRLITASLILGMAASAWSQKSVTLWQCYDSAAVVSSLSGERDLYSAMSGLHDMNLAAAWLPSLDLNGSFSYQSDVVDMSDMLSSLPVPAGSLPSIPHEQYRATLDISQVFWDGGVTRSARAVEQVVSELNMKQNDAEIYRLREQVNNYYFSLLLTASQMEVTGLLIADLDARISETASAVSNGVLTAVTLDVLKAEKIKAAQMLTELTRRHDALAGALEHITGMTGLKDAELMLPEPTITGDETIDNPDLRLFDAKGIWLCTGWIWQPSG